jgi:hypothetical protein
MRSHRATKAKAQSKGSPSDSTGVESILQGTSHKLQTWIDARGSQWLVGIFGSVAASINNQRNRRNLCALRVTRKGDANGHSGSDAKLATRWTLDRD